MLSGLFDWCVVQGGWSLRWIGLRGCIGGCGDVDVYRVVGMVGRLSYFAQEIPYFEKGLARSAGFLGEECRDQEHA